MFLRSTSTGSLCCSLVSFYAVTDVVADAVTDAVRSGNGQLSRKIPHASAALDDYRSALRFPTAPEAAKLESVHSLRQVSVLDLRIEAQPSQSAGRKLC